MALTKVSAALANLDGAVVINESSADVDFRIESDDSTHMLFVDGGNDRVGINEDAPQQALSVGLTAGSLSGISLTLNDTDLAAFLSSSSTGEVRIGGVYTNYFPTFYSSNSEAMRITTGGTVLIGKTALDNTTAGVRLNASGQATLARNGSLLYLNRNTTNGDLIEFAKDNSLVGTIGVDGSDLTFDINGSERMKLNSDGKLSVTEINHITSGTLEIGNGDEKQLFDASGATIQFQTSDSERMRITTNNVFLNQTATADSGVADGRLEITRGSQHCLNCHVAGTGNSTLVAFINDNGFVGGINTNGSATAFNTSSDARLKNILGEAKGLEVVNALNPVNFEWKSDGKIQDGLIAQEVEKVFPEAVSEPELEGEWYSVDYSKLVTPLIKAMQEQQTQIEELKKEIETLKN